MIVSCLFCGQFGLQAGGLQFTSEMVGHATIIHYMTDLSIEPVATPKHSRLAHLTLFFNIKDRFAWLPRQTLFLAIAIFDKLHLALASPASFSQTDLLIGQPVRVAACLWLAWKFLEVRQIPLKKLLQKMQIVEMQREQIVAMEADILQAIDFELPTDIPYFSLVREFQMETLPAADGKILVGQCLGFLKEGVLSSGDFSLVGELGPQILKLYSRKLLTDRRLKEVYYQATHRQRPRQPLTA